MFSPSSIFSKKSTISHQSTASCNFEKKTAVVTSSSELDEESFGLEGLFSETDRLELNAGKINESTDKTGYLFKNFPLPKDVTCYALGFLSPSSQVHFASTFKFGNEAVQAVRLQTTSLKIGPHQNVQTILEGYLVAKLKQLDLTDANVSDKDLNFIAKNFPKIQKIILRNCSMITDDGLQSLKPLTALTSLNIAWCNKITDKGCKVFASLTALTDLNFNGNKNITDNALKELKNLNALKSLNLCDCHKITNNGLDELAFLNALSSLNIQWCHQITGAAVRKLAFLKTIEIKHTARG